MAWPICFGLYMQPISISVRFVSLRLSLFFRFKSALDRYACSQSLQRSAFCPEHSVKSHITRVKPRTLRTLNGHLELLSNLLIYIFWCWCFSKAISNLSYSSSCSVDLVILGTERTDGTGALCPVRRYVIINRNHTVGVKQVDVSCILL